MILRMRSACYVRKGETIVAPVDVELRGGERVARRCSNELEAATLAMMASAIARATSGSVLIGEYDPRVQPVHCKKLAAFVPHEPLPLQRRELDRYITYRAALWNVDAQSARIHAASLLQRFDGMHEAFAYPIVGALIGLPQLLVLDRPQEVFQQQILDAVGDCAVFTTHL
jgi:ABC-type multidrug transport system ATPase subunit